MKVKLAATGIVAIIICGLPSTAIADDDTFAREVYAACVSHMSHHIMSTGDDPVEFASFENAAVMADDYEVLVNLPAGTITGADTEEPNPITLVNQPAGGCTALVGTRELTRVVVNGEVVNQGNLAF